MADEGPQLPPLQPLPLPLLLVSPAQTVDTGPHMVPPAQPVVPSVPPVKNGNTRSIDSTCIELVSFQA